MCLLALTRKTYKSMKSKQEVSFVFKCDLTSTFVVYVCFERLCRLWGENILCSFSIHDIICTTKQVKYLYCIDIQLHILKILLFAFSYFNYLKCLIIMKEQLRNMKSFDSRMLQYSSKIIFIIVLKPMFS